VAHFSCFFGKVFFEGAIPVLVAFGLFSGVSPDVKSDLFCCSAQVMEEGRVGT
jgi:hypothetical protein